VGVSRSPAELAGKLRGFTKAMVSGQADATKTAGFMVAGLVETELSRVVPSRRLRSGARAGRSTGRSLSVRVDTLRQQPDKPGVVVAARGPWQVIERDTRSGYAIFPKATTRDVGRALVSLAGQGRSRRSGSKRSRALAFQGGGFAAYVLNHPGTKGRHPFEKGADRGRKLAPVLFSRELTRSLSRVF
jgi:hypothetical protein